MIIFFSVQKKEEIALCRLVNFETGLYTRVNIATIQDRNT